MGLAGNPQPSLIGHYGHAAADPAEGQPGPSLDAAGRRAGT